MRSQHLPPSSKTLGPGFTVRRALPSARRQSVGPFLFFDHFGPIEIGPEDRHDVRPHPHIGLATVTYLFDGAMQHRDSTGVSQRIEPGAINWMTAGRGIVHSERRPVDLQGRAYRLHGLQLWVALPAAHEEDAPAFSHTAAAEIPAHEAEGLTVRVLVGEAHGLASPVQTLSPMLFLDARLDAGRHWDLPAAAAGVERALYVVDGACDLAWTDGLVEPLPAQTLAVLPEGSPVQLRNIGAQGARVALVGGAPLGPRHMWWNFVSSQRERIVAAADAWERDAMGRIEGETERIALPETRPH